MTEDDGYWKFSTHNQINLLGGHVFLASQASDPGKIFLNAFFGCMMKILIGNIEFILKKSENLSIRKIS